MATEIKVPVLPESVSDATIAGWHKKVGDAVKRDENLVDLETDKVVLEVPSPADGVLKEIKFDTGATVNSQQVIAIIEEGAVAAAPTQPAAAAAPAPAAAPAAAATSAPAAAPRRGMAAAPPPARAARHARRRVVRRGAPFMFGRRATPAPVAFDRFPYDILNLCNPRFFRDLPAFFRIV